LNPKDWTEKEIELAKKISAQRGLSELVRENEIKIRKQEKSGCFFSVLKFTYYFICSILLLAGIVFIRERGGLFVISVSFFLLSLPTIISSLKLKVKSAKEKKKSAIFSSILKYIYHLICWLTLVIGILGISQDEDKRIGICIISLSALLFIAPIIIKAFKRKRKNDNANKNASR
jgi:L-asparagine transporter-like permease